MGSLCEIILKDIERFNSTSSYEDRKLLLYYMKSNIESLAILLERLEQQVEESEK